MKKVIVGLVGLVTLVSLAWPKAVVAGPALGIHLLDPRELPAALELVRHGAVTVVLRSDDRDQRAWQQFLDQAAQAQIMPIIRLATNWQGDSWRRPTRRDIVEHARFLSSLNWHTDQLRVVMFNEPNHAAEWGGKVDPEDYGRVLSFAAAWFHTEAKKYVVLPAGLDAAAPNDNLEFIRRMLANNPALINQIDGWTAHAYANPGFAGSPNDKGKMGIRGFEYELNLLKRYANRDWPVYITEAGWKRTAKNSRLVADYYTQALKQAWSDANIQAVTPFVFAAGEGPFQAFAFVNPDGSPTPQYAAWKKLTRNEVFD
jgi:hypothetical protein